MTVTLRTSGGSQAVLDTEPGDPLAALTGTLLTPDSPGYDEARTIWNGMIDRRPGLIVQCDTAADVASAVRFARAHDLLRPDGTLDTTRLLACVEASTSVGGS